MARVDRDRRYFSWWLVGFGCVLMLVLFAVGMLQLGSNIRTMNANDDAMRDQINVLDKELLNLKLELARVGSDGYVENEARENFGFIRDGEIVFAFTDGDALRGYTEDEYRIIMEEMRD